MVSQTVYRSRLGNLANIRMGAAAHDRNHATHKKRLSGLLHRPAADCSGPAATNLRVMQAHPDRHARFS